MGWINIRHGCLLALILPPPSAKSPSLRSTPHHLLLHFLCSVIKVQTPNHDSSLLSVPLTMQRFLVLFSLPFKSSRRPRLSLAVPGSSVATRKYLARNKCRTILCQLFAWLGFEASASDYLAVCGYWSPEVAGPPMSSGGRPPTSSITYSYAAACGTYLKCHY